MTKFLENIAGEYISRYNGDLSDTCFVFPSRRSQVYFLEEVRRQSGDRGIISPKTVSIADWVEEVSGRIVDSHLDQLLLLYSVIRDIQIKKNTEPLTFDKFRSWGDTILSDFTDVDMYMVNAEALFSNLKDVREIKSHYLEPDQIEVMKKYFNLTNQDLNPQSFWEHFNNPKSKYRNKTKFLHLWEILWPAYKEFHRRLEKQGLTSTGHAYLQTLENILRDEKKALPYSRIVFIGFNALSTVEYMIFNEVNNLRRPAADGGLQRLADFYWDCTGVPMSNPANPASHFLKKNIAKFKSEFDISDSDNDKLIETAEIISSPSFIGQAKIIRSILSDLLGKEHTPEPISPSDIAVVLPDEELLLPVLQSLPKEVENPNLTMGYSLRYTSPSTLLHLLQQLQRTMRKQAGAYYFKQSMVCNILKHPLTGYIMESDTLNTLNNTVSLSKFMYIEADKLAINPPAAMLFRHVEGKQSDCINYIRQIFTQIRDTIQNNIQIGHTVDANLDLWIIDHYLDAIQLLEYSLRKYSITADIPTTFNLINRLLSAGHVLFEGVPLHGVQIMGVLETRCLDFDYIILPSMNERIYPRKLRKRSFIPNTLRRGYNMATTQFQDSIYAYYFYRMISRARKVYMLYDSRTGLLNSGAPSRYLLQLKHLYAPTAVREKTYNFTVQTEAPTPIEIPKTPAVMEKIKKYFVKPILSKEKKKSVRYLSSSSLHNYLSCPMKFYLFNVMGLREEDERTDGLPSNIKGSVVHETLKEIYTPVGGKFPYLVTREMISGWLTNTDAIKNLVKKKIQTEYYKEQENAASIKPLPENTAVYVTPLTEIVRRVLKYDLYKTPFTYIEGEQKKYTTLPLTNPVRIGDCNYDTVNINYIIDRVDNQNNDVDSDSRTIRIVDYKTGNFTLKVSDISDMFASEPAAKELFQLLLYSYLYAQDNNIDTKNIHTVIYGLRTLSTTAAKSDISTPEIDSQKPENISEYENTFMQELNKKLQEFADPNIPFRQNKTPENCKYCPFKDNVCNLS